MFGFSHVYLAFNYPFAFLNYISEDIINTMVDKIFDVHSNNICNIEDYKKEITYLKETKNTYCEKSSGIVVNVLVFVSVMYLFVRCCISSILRPFQNILLCLTVNTLDESNN